MTRQSDPTGPRPGLFENRYAYDEIRVGSKTGETLMAFDEQALEYVVVKRPGLTQPNPDLYHASVADLRREERVLGVAGICDHPAVCRLLHAGEATGPQGSYHYLVLARARGIPIPTLIQRYHAQGQPFPEWDYLNITRQLLDLLAAAQRAGVVYNDVKADHLFWDEAAGQLKVIDWGNARFAAEDYAPGPADDVFQCGELLYEFITGDKYSPVTLSQPAPASPVGPGWQAAGAPRWQAKFYSPAPPDLERLVSRALHPDPARRFAHAGEMAAALETYARGRARWRGELLAGLGATLNSGDARDLADAQAALSALLSYHPADPTAAQLQAQFRERQAELAQFERDWRELAELPPDAQAGARLWAAYARTVAAEAETLPEAEGATFRRRAQQAARELLADGLAREAQALACLQAGGANLLAPENKLLELVGEIIQRPLLPGLLGRAYRLVEQGDLPAREQLTQELAHIEARGRKVYRERWDGYFRRLSELQSDLLAALPVVAGGLDLAENEPHPGAGSPEALAAAYQALAARLLNWRSALEIAAPVGLAVPPLQALPAALIEARAAADSTATHLRDAGELLRQGNYPAYEVSLRLAEALDPHNPAFARLRRQAGDLDEALTYAGWLAPESGPAEFGEWLARAEAALALAATPALQSPAAQTERSKLARLAEAWGETLAAARLAHARQLAQAAARLHRQAAADLLAPAITTVTARLAGLAGSAPPGPTGVAGAGWPPIAEGIGGWRFLPDADFVLACNRLAATLDEGLTDTATMHSLWARASREAHGDEAAERWVAYFVALGEAQIALAGGQLAEAAARLATAGDSPACEARHERLAGLLRLGQALQAGEAQAASRLHGALLERYGQALYERAPGATLAESLALLPGLRGALQAFIEHPAEIGPGLEGRPGGSPLPGPLRSATVVQALKCSHNAQAGQNHCRAGDFSAAQAAFTQALEGALALPARYLDVPLRAAAGPLERAREGARLCREQLQSLLAHVEQEADPARLLRDPLVYNWLRDIAAQVPVRGESRPALWLATYEELARKAGVGAAALLQERGLAPGDPIYPLFAAIAARGAGGERSPARQPVPRRSRLRGGGRPGWALPAGLAAVIVLVALAVGIAMRGRAPRAGQPATEVAELASARAPVAVHTGTVAAATALPATASTGGVTPPRPPTAAVSPLQIACQNIAQAAGAGQWQLVVDEVLRVTGGLAPADASCGGRALLQELGNAYYQLGREAYQAGDYAAALQHWTQAQGVGLDTQAPLALLLECAAARQANDPALYQGLADRYGAAEVGAQCGFDPLSLTPLTLDLLAALAERRMIMTGACPESPCPSLYQDDRGDWHLGTFFGNNELVLPLDEAFQARVTDQQWGDRLRAVEVQFTINSSQPNSFGYGAQFGLEVRSPGQRPLRLLLTSQPVVSAAVSAARPDDDDMACPLNAVGPLVIIGAGGEFQSHTLTLRWDPSTGQLQFFVDDQAVCSAPISFSETPQVALYLTSRGANLRVSRLSASLARPK